MDIITKPALEIWGGFGLVVIVLVIGLVTLWKYLTKVLKEHREERDRWLETVNNQFQENNSILKRIEGILETLRRVS